MNLQSLVPLILKISIALSVIALGLKATVSDATCLFRRPGELGRALLSMNILMPLLAVALALMLNLHPAVKIALVALSVSPVPPLFPKMALKQGGKTDYAVGLSVATSVMAILVIPITMRIFERVGGVPLSMSASSVAKMVLITVLAPLLVGIALRAMLPAFAERSSEPLGLVATALLVLSVFPVLLGSIPTIFSLVGDGTLLSFGGFALVGYVIGYLLGGPETENRRVLALATASRHPAIAVGIAHGNFPQQKLAVPAIVLYLIVSGIVTGVASKLNNQRALGQKPKGEMAAT